MNDLMTSVVTIGWVPGPLEMSIFLVIVLLLFGNRLPSVMRSMGQGITEFKKGIKEGDDSAKQSIGQEKEE